MTIHEYRAYYPYETGLDCGIETFFDTFINVYGVTVAAMPNTPVPEIIHAAKVYAQLMDSDEDYIPDDMNIYDYHQNEPEGRNVIIVLVDSRDYDNAWVAYRPCQPYWIDQALRPDHSGVGHSRDGEKDTAVEELFHRISHAWQSVYREELGQPDEEAGEIWSSTLSDAMDLARGIDRTVTPVDCEGGEQGCEDGRRWVYPEGAWYTYNDTSCGWSCMLGEYFWWVWSTWIGYTETLTRARGVPEDEARPHGWCDDINGEWRPCTREDFETMDPMAFDLLNNQGFALPATIPYGEYGGNDVEFHGHEVEVRSTDSGDRFFINRIQHTELTFKRGNTYYFDQSLESNAEYDFRFSITGDGTHAGGVEYTYGVTTRGVAGERGSYTKITVPEDAPDTLYYYCTNHAGLAGDSSIVVID
jgi:hypothetical protein